MPKRSYTFKKFRPESLKTIEHAVEIIEDYGTRGYDLTLRQLFYQFVSRELIPNTQKSYKRLGSLVNDARLAGLIDWNTIKDRTRNVRRSSHWRNPAAVLSSAAHSYRTDRRKDQPRYIEVWVEKDALIGVIEPLCNRLDVPCFSCRGYVSQSEMWAACERLRWSCYDDNTEAYSRSPVIIHLGDHDPSGIDMTRDIFDRLELFAGYGDCSYEGDNCDPFDVDVVRIALNRPQVEIYDLPPNPAKMTDARASGYVAEHGASSWELDALAPETLEELITESVNVRTDGALMEAAIAREDEDRRTLMEVAHNYHAIKRHLDEGLL